MRALFSGKYLGIFLKIINAEHISKRIPIRLVGQNKTVALKANAPKINDAIITV